MADHKHLLEQGECTDCLKRTIKRFREKNARLLVDVKEARDFLSSALRNVHLARSERDEAMAQTDEALRERDGYKALARRRRKPRRLLEDARELIDRLAENAEELTPFARRVRRALDRILHP